MTNNIKNVAIKVDNVSKSFVLPHESVSSVKDGFLNIFRAKNRAATQQHALKDISFEIKKGEFFGIVGRNGSGKSTLLKLIANIYRPTKGSITVDGRLVPFIELGVGFNPELTGRENVYLSCALSGFNSKEVDEMYEDIVSFAELEDFMDQKLKNYSSGMQVRLAFSVATRSDADILLIDEVLAVGDADFQRKCFNYFKSLKKSKKTVIFVSHDMDAVREYCDRALLINESEVVDVGTPDAVAQHYTKLFTMDTMTEDHSGDKVSNRWGKGGIKTEEIKISKTEDTLIVVQKVISKANIKNPIIGIRIRSVSGEQVAGTNTKLERIKLKSFSKGDETVITWSLPNILADGDYYIDPAIIGEDGITIYDWWDEAKRFTIAKDRTLPYNVDPGFKVKIRKLNHDFE